MALAKAGIELGENGSVIPRPKGSLVKPNKRSADRIRSLAASAEQLRQLGEVAGYAAYLILGEHLGHVSVVRILA